MGDTESLHDIAYVVVPNAKLYIYVQIILLSRYILYLDIFNYLLNFTVVSCFYDFLFDEKATWFFHLPTLGLFVARNLQDDLGSRRRIAGRR